MNTIKWKLVLTGILMGLTTVNGLSQETRANLTKVLNELAKSRNVIISFSPNLTDALYPGAVSLDGEVSDVLKRLLAGRKLAFKCVKDGLYYIYENKTVAARHKPVVRQEKVDTTQVKVEKADSVPEKVLPLLDKESSTAIKTNMLYLATGTLNLGVEVKLAPRWTIDFSAGYNGWSFSDKRRIRHFLIQPEARYWTKQCFEGSFWGAHAHYAHYSVGGVLGMDSRYEGWLLGAGVSYGKSWVVGDDWRIEAVVGAGYSYLNRDKYTIDGSGRIYRGASQHYWGIDKLSVSLVYLIK